VAPKRKSERALVSIVARYRSPLIFDYVNERCYDLSYGGMFIKSSNPVNPGTLLKLECLIDDGPEKIQGVARVIWVRRVDRTEGPRGMGVKFVKLEPGSEELIEKIIEKVALFPQKAEDSLEEAAAAQTSRQLDTETREPPERLEKEGNEAEESPREYDDSGLLEHPPSAEQSAAVTASSAPEQKATIFPKWAIAVCAIALVGLVYISLYDDDKSVKSAERKILEKTDEEKPLSSSKQEKSVPRVAVANQIAESKPGAEEANTRSNPAMTENRPIQTDRKYVLRITTSPPGARVLVNSRSIISPGTLELDDVSSPIHVTAFKMNYHSTRVIVEPSIFVQKAKAMEGRVHLDLEPKPLKPEALQSKQTQKEQLDQAETQNRKSPTQTDQTDSIGDKDQPTKTTEANSQPDDQPDDHPTLFEIATQCISKGDNACVIETLKDKTSTEAELGLLVETYRAVGDTKNATKYMKRFIRKYPKSDRAKIYQKIVATP